MTYHYHSDIFLSSFDFIIRTEKEKGGVEMKKLEIIIRPEKLDVLKKILTEDGISGMMISNIMGFGNQKGYTHQYRGTTYAVNLVSKLKVETVIRDEQVEDLMQKIRNELSTGHVGDGKIFVYPVEDEHNYTDQKGNVLPDAILIPKGSVPRELAYMVHSDIGDNFMHAVDARKNMRVASDYELSNNDIISIITR